VVRRYSLGWLAALIAVVTLGLLVILALPIRTCPTCRGLARKLADPETGFVSSRIGCPECGDRGSVTEPQRWKGSLVSPQVSRLLQCGRPERRGEFVPTLDEIAALSGGDPGDVLGTKAFGGQWSGAARFLQSEGKDFVLVVLRGYSKFWNGLEGLALLGMDGRVLDHVHCGCAPGGLLTMEVLDEARADGTVAVLLARWGLLPEEFNPGPEQRRTFPLKAVLEGSGREFPAQEGARDKAWLVRIRTGHFEILVEPAAGPR
jgi:hypothetical protein